MSLRQVPLHVRVHLYLFWAGAVAAALGIVGFFLSFNEVGSPAQAVYDVQYDVPELAYASIAAWVIGLLLMWYSRRRLNAAVAKRQAETRSAMLVDVDAFTTPNAEAPAPSADTDNAVDAPDGREP